VLKFVIIIYRKQQGSCPIINYIEKEHMPFMAVVRNGEASLSDKGSVFQTGGGGTNFEQAVQTAFVVTLIIRGNVPCIESGELTEIGLQVKKREYETDDLLAIAKNPTATHRLLIQIKHDISFTKGNDQFKQVIKDFWQDYNNSAIFDRNRDKLIIVKSGLTKHERNHVKSLLNWAVTHATETDFIKEVERIKAKNDALEVFHEVLLMVNNNNALTDNEIWQFLRCVDVLEYDFLNEGSVDKTYFLNLIKLSRRKDSELNEVEIWDRIFARVSELNQAGGNLTIESLKNESFFHYFENEKLTPYFSAVQKLKSDSKTILSPIRSSLGKGDNQIKLPRTEAKEKIFESIINSQICIITGKPGVGKSAIIKEILQQEFPNASTFVFRADQFNEPSLANVFSRLGVTASLYDIFSSISLIPEKIIFIDSLEKLLEADAECAFNQLFELLKEHPDIKLIAASRKFAIDLILKKFGIDPQYVSQIEIPLLGVAELAQLENKFPQLSAVLKNEKINKLLRCPKYIDFSITAISKAETDYSSLSLSEFKGNLWDSLVVDSTNIKNGLPIKRDRAFMEIAVKRAEEMKLFTEPREADPEAVVCLLKDEIIFQEKNNSRYAPSHDILEDWALVKHVSAIYEDYPDSNEFFTNLGNEPAIRRAFRLWVEDILIDDTSKISELIRSAIANPTIQKYWADELLVAVFKSENSSYFFTSFENELLAENSTFFNRCLHIINTCCKESDQKTNYYKILLPIGSGWTGSLIFIQKHISQLEEIRLSILKFLKEWYYHLMFQRYRIEKEELEAGKSIILHYLSEIENEGRFWQGKIAEKEEENLITILFNLAYISRNEINQLVGRAFANLENRDAWRLNEFYEKVIQNVLSGLGNNGLVKEYPELIIVTAGKYWKYIPPKEDDFSEHRLGRLTRHSLRDAECWGIKNGHSFFPSGIYKTPALDLLIYHPRIGLQFIIEFINYSIEFYIKADCEYKHNISQIEIELNDGTLSTKWAAWELWAGFRGLSVTNHLLESLLMSFEKFLLELAARGTDVSKKNVKFIFDYVLKNSNNIAPLAVLTSVAIAYPEVIEEAMLPLLSVREFYDWDLSRALNENSTLSVKDYDIPFAQKERWESNQLQHRKKYPHGLRDFIVDYQFNVRKLNQQIHKVFDKLHTKSNNGDFIGKKLLNEIDIRKWEVRADDENPGRFVVQPNYEEEVVKYLDSNKDYIEAQNISAKYSEIILNGHQNEGTISFEKWAECHIYYSKTKDINFIYSRPITLAVIGLSEFSGSISEKQKNWCLETLFHSIIAILQDTLSRNHELNKSYNFIEKEIALSSFHLLMEAFENDDDRNGIIATIISLLIAPFGDHEINNITQYIREIFFKLYPTEAKKVWLGLIKYSIYKKADSIFDGHQSKNSLKKARRKEKEFVHQISSDKNLKLDLSEISLDKCEANLLARALLITPFNTMDQDYLDFVIHLLPIVLDDLAKEEDNSDSRSSEARQFLDESIPVFEKYLANLFLDANIDFSKPVLTILVSSLPSLEQVKRTRRNDLLEFVKTTLDYFVLKLHDNGNIEIDQTRYMQQQNNFWDIWEVLCNLLPANENHPLKKKLLLNIRFLLWDSDWNPNEIDWCVLNGKKEFYKKMLIEKGRVEVSSAIDVFSTIGGKEFLPEGISWLRSIFDSDFEASACLASPSSERMIKRLFHNHISEIKKNKKLFNDYFWILNRMVDLGSSEAYFFRENVITFKSNSD